jgi:gliding motility-associated-like protein
MTDLSSVMALPNPDYQPKMKKLLLGIILIVMTRPVCYAQIIDHFAGGTKPGWTGDGGPAISAEIFYPFNMEFDAAGNLYFSEVGNHIIRKIDPGGIISTIAGTSQNAGFGGDGGLAKTAKLNSPTGIAVDKNGIVYIADWLNHRIRKIDAAGLITTIAGTGIVGYSGDGGPAINAKLNLEGAVDIALDSKGNLYISQPELFIVRKIDPAGIITTVIGNGIKGYSGDNGNALNAQLTLPNGLAIDKNDNIYVADAGSNTVRKISSAGMITTFAGSPGNGYSGDGGPATNAKFQIGSPTGLAVDGCGNVYVADYSNHVIRKIDPAGIISTVAGNNIGNVTGDGGPATSASIWFPANVAVDPSNNLYIPDAFNNTIRKVTNAGVSIISQPKDVTLCPKGTAKFMVQSAVNDTYAWELNNGLGWQKVSDGPVYSGGLTSTLSVVVNDLSFDKIQYRCIISNACTNTTSKAATLNVPADAAPTSIVIAPDKPEVCEGTKMTFNATILNEGSVTNYEWFVNGVSANSTTKQFQSATLKNGDKVTLSIITNPNSACSSGVRLSSNELTIKINNSPKPLLADRASICSGQSHVFDPGEFKTYLWHDGTTGRAFEATRTGLYFVTVTNELGCIGSDTAEIKSVLMKTTVTLPADTTVCEGTSLTIRPDRNFSSYRWSDGSTDNTLKVNKTGVYSIEVKDANNCKASDSMVVNYRSCHTVDQVLAAPNAFTPNGDGLNDLFRPKIPGTITGYRLAIYNRWGQMLFETRDRNKAWNGGPADMQGTSNTSSNISSNTYTWVCEYADESGKKIIRKGSVILIR